MQTARQPRSHLDAESDHTGHCSASHTEVPAVHETAFRSSLPAVFMLRFDPAKDHPWIVLVAGGASAAANSDMFRGPPGHSFRVYVP